MFTRKPDATQLYASARAQATDAVATPVASYDQNPEYRPDYVDNAGRVLEPTTYEQPVANPSFRGAVTHDVNESIIGPDLRIIGNVVSRGRVRLEGTIEGDMRCTSLVVSQTGAITGGIVAGDVAVYGRVAGTIRGRRVALYATAHVEGDITHQGIGVEMGTHYDGRLRWSAQPMDDLEQIGHDVQQLA
jgi:cytoskeletal protein CcmA (bactofilin family)